MVPFYDDPDGTHCGLTAKAVPGLGGGMGREAGFSAAQRTVRLSVAPVEMTEFGGGSRKSNGKSRCWRVEVTFPPITREAAMDGAPMRMWLGREEQTAARTTAKARTKYGDSSLRSE